MRMSASVLLVTAVLLGGRGARAETRLGAFAGPAVFAHGGSLGASHIGPAAGLAIDLSLTESLGLSFRPGYYEKGGSGWDASYLGTPVLLRYPTRPGPYLVAGGEANLLVSDSWVSRTDLALTAGLGASWGRDRGAASSRGALAGASRATAAGSPLLRPSMGGPPGGARGPPRTAPPIDHRRRPSSARPRRPTGEWSSWWASPST